MPLTKLPYSGIFSLVQIFADLPPNTASLHDDIIIFFHLLKFFVVFIFTVATPSAKTAKFCTIRKIFRYTVYNYYIPSIHKFGVRVSRHKFGTDNIIDDDEHAMVKQIL